MKYIGFLPDKTAITKDSLEELNKVPHLEYILTEVRPDQDYPQTPSWPKYSIINQDGSTRIVQIGKYEVIDIDYKNVSSKSGRVATIIEIDSKHSYHFNMSRIYSDFLTLELLPLLNELNQFGNLNQFIKNKDNEEKIAFLNNKILESNRIIADLRIKLEASSKQDQ